MARLKELLDGAWPRGVPAERVRLDLSIARGLDYYTGTVFETFLDALPGIGSVCSGGRYDNLAELFTEQELPGIGASLGLDRLLAAMEELGMIEKVSTPAPVFIPYFDAGPAARLSAAGGRVAARPASASRSFPMPKKLGQQLKYADRRGFRVALIAGGDEFAIGRLPDQGPSNRHEARRAAGAGRGQHHRGGERHPWTLAKRRTPYDRYRWLTDGLSKRTISPSNFFRGLPSAKSWRKEVHRPVYHVHKWWAKRLGTVFRGILLGCALDETADLPVCFYARHSFSDLAVFDPFMGSGTTIGEAHKLGFRSLGRDINPVAVESVRVALGPMDRRKIKDAFAQLSDGVGETIHALYRSKDSRDRPCNVLYYFWVMQAGCPHCHRDVRPVFLLHYRQKCLPR